MAKSKADWHPANPEVEDEWLPLRGALQKATEASGLPAGPMRRLIRRAHREGAIPKGGTALGCRVDDLTGRAEVQC